MSLKDTIAAPITAVGGPVALIRVSGPDALDAVGAIVGGWPTSLVSHQAHHRRFCTGDDGLVIAFLGDRSYTGEPSVELSCHGSLASVSCLMDALMGQGVRLAEPGEFTLRAFMNGKMDLSSAEAVRDLVEAQSALQLQAAGRAAQGGIREWAHRQRTLALKELARIEASVDFSEEIGEYDPALGEQAAEAMLQEIGSALQTAGDGMLLRKGLRIALTGRPNAGKSTLLNAILGTQRAITAPEPGTTRDYLEEGCLINGIPCVLIDTAGIRDTDSAIEAEGVRRAQHIARTADRVWHVFDAQAGLSDEERVWLDEFEHTVLIANKSDLAQSPDGITISALTGAGLQVLLATVTLSDAAAPFYLQERHTAPLRAAQAALELVSQQSPSEMLSTVWREVADSLGVITGETADPDMTARIFADFCVGK